MNRFNKYITTIFLFLILLTPLIYDKTGFYGYVVPKALLFQISVLLCAIIYLFSIKQVPTISYNYLSASIFIFGFVTIVINVMSYDTLFSIGATFERMEGAINTLLLCLLFFLFVPIFNSEIIQKYAFIFMLTVAFIVAVFGLISSEKIAGRLIATIGNPAFLCFYLANHLFLTAIFYVKYKPRFTWLLFVNLMVLIWVIINTLTRTFYIAMIFAGITMIILYIYTLIKKEKRVKVLIYSSLSLVLMALLLFLFSQNIWIRKNLPIGRLTNSSSLDARFLVWNIAIRGFTEHWLLGWGQENFNYVYAKFFNPKLANDGVWYDRSHNVFLDWFVSGGLIGGIAYISIWISVIFVIWRSNFLHLMKILLTGWAVFYCCFIFFNPDSLINTIFAIFIFAFIYLNSSTKNINNLFLNRHFFSIKLFSIGVLCTFLYQFTYQNICSYQVFSKAMAEPTIENLVELSNKAYSIRSAVNVNMVEQLSVIHQTVLESQLLPEQKQFYTQSLQKLIEKELRRHPPSVKLLELKSMVELNINDIEAGNQTLDKMIDLSPNYVVAYMRKGRTAIAQKNLDNAMIIFDKVLEIAPQYTPAKLFRIYVKALKEPNYDIKLGLKQVTEIDLADNITLVKDIFIGLGKPKDFVDWIWGGSLYDIFMPKQVYLEWITTAFQNGDIAGMKRMLTVYNDNYECDKYLSEKIIIDAQQGIHPNKSLTELMAYSKAK